MGKTAFEDMDTPRASVYELASYEHTKGPIVIASHDDMLT